jgi:predicted transcriptional regulator
MKPLTPLELEIMDVIWDLKKATVRQVFEVFREHRKLAYTTVMTVMGTLEQKGHLRRSLKGRAYTYEPTRTRRAAISAQVQDFLDRVFDGSAKPLVLSLVQSKKLSKKELDEIARLAGEEENKP